VIFVSLIKTTSFEFLKFIAGALDVGGHQNTNKGMKDIILEHIQAEGPIKEKKLWKQIVKVLSLSETGENGESEIYEQKKTLFKDICQNLLTEKDILAVAGEYSINKAKKAIPQTNTKRKSSWIIHLYFSV
jgi:hypothetical protein